MEGNNNLKEQLQAMQAQNILLQNQISQLQTNSSTEVCRVAVKLPVFWPEKPDLWFRQVEANFDVSDITSDSTKYNYVLGQLDHKYIAEIEDIIANPPSTNKYNKLKSELIRRVSVSEEQRLRQLLSGEQIGDRKPTQFLRHLRSLGGSSLPDDILRQLWFRRLPDHVQTVLAAHSDATLDALALKADNIIELLEHSMPAGRVAAFFAETIQGVGGTLQYPKGYLKKAYQLIKKYGGLYVADEVQTGFGRTGDNFWAFEGLDIVPDIVTMAKGIGNGFPLAAVVTTKEIAAVHTRATYFNTFGGNPLASAAGKAVLEVIEEENLQKNCKVVGKHFIEKLMDLQSHHPMIGDVRGKGLMLGVELVEPGTKEPLNDAHLLQIVEAIKDMGVLVGRGGKNNNVLRIKPPMCITKEDVNFSIYVIDEALQLISKNSEIK